MVSRRKLLAGVGTAVLLPAFPTFAQQAKIARIGILHAGSRPTPSNPDPLFGGFMKGMQELGYVEGKNLAIEQRFAEGKYERLPALAAELVHLKPDVIVTGATPPAQALKQATNTIPIVMAAVSDPVGSGLVASLARPGGNITGLSLITVDLSPKHLEFLKIVLPSLSRVAVLMNPGTSFHSGVLKSVQAAAQAKGVQVVAVSAANPAELERGFEQMGRDGLKAVIVVTDAFFIARRKQIVDLGFKHRIATVSVDRLNALAGGLMSYGTDIPDSFRRAATYVDKILKGARPGDLPIEQPTTFLLTINRKTATALGIKIPQELLQRADEVIE